MPIAVIFTCGKTPSLFDDPITPQQLIENYLKQKDNFLQTQEKKSVEKLEREREKILELRDRVLTMFPIRIRSKELLPKIIFHVGPTNSGKTYRALEKLKQADKRDLFSTFALARLGDLRELNTSTTCTLLTGEEVIYKENAKCVSATVEMFPQNNILGYYCS